LLWVERLPVFASWFRFDRSSAAAVAACPGLTSPTTRCPAIAGSTTACSTTARDSAVSGVACVVDRSAIAGHRAASTRSTAVRRATAKGAAGGRTACAAGNPGRPARATSTAGLNLPARR
jgi:hypothetical protein